MNNNIPAVEKTLTLLEILSSEEKGLTQSQLKEKLHISMSTCYRILQTLLAKEWVRKDENSVYHPGKALYPLFMGFRSSFLFPEGLLTILEQVSRKYEIGCKLSIRQGSFQLTIYRSDPSGSEMTPAFSGKRASRFPVIEGSVGAVLLAEETKENILLLAENCETDIPEKTVPQLIFDRKDFLHKYGYCHNENNRWHICAFSVPVKDSSGKTAAALTFILPRHDLDAKTQKKYIMLLKETCEKCENMIKKGE